MEYSNSIHFSGDVEKAFDMASRILMANNFTVVDQDENRLEFTGQGMRSTKQNPILGATRITIEADYENLHLNAELGGVEWMRRFVTYFPKAMAAGLISIYAVVVSCIVFFLPVAVVWQGILLGVPIIGLVFAPWRFISPMMIRMIKRRTDEALDSLLTNIAAAGNRAVERTFH